LQGRSRIVVLFVNIKVYPEAGYEDILVVRYVRMPLSSSCECTAHTTTYVWMFIQLSSSTLAASIQVCQVCICRPGWRYLTWRHLSLYDAMPEIEGVVHFLKSPANDALVRRREVRLVLHFNRPSLYIYGPHTWGYFIHCFGLNSPSRLNHVRIQSCWNWSNTGRFTMSFSRWDRGFESSYGVHRALCVLASQCCC
jgi:hypothetical protein